ncbi:MAG: 4Fe-4S dicluster domain-containing protein [Polyangiaceae bacterium]|nr:4Fe-4S dicluster domain-containing protein [Polyangiaceae bacterium]
MSVLHPAPIAWLARRLFRELHEKNAAFDLPARKFVRGEQGVDLSVHLGSRVAASPFGPAAGPHTQLAQNLVLSWLAGGRAIELKTVQVDDHLTIPRPCIDMREVGYNCEYSQELQVEESLREYAKGSLLIAMLANSGKVGVVPSFLPTVFDASVGYDLAGIQSEKVDRYLRALRKFTPVVDEQRRQVPPEYAEYAGGNFPDALVDTVSLSTFHGSPPGEIEAIAAYLMGRYRVGVIVKLNPTLLGKVELNGLLNDTLGYTDVVVPSQAFDMDLTFLAAVEMIHRLTVLAKKIGVTFGIKLTNTLVVENRRPFFPANVNVSYLSGPPLHVLAMTLVERFRREVGTHLPISFSAGIDAQNVADAVALNLTPVTVCTDWLKTGGYGRGIRFFETLVARMRRAGAKSRDAFILRAFGQEEAAAQAALPAEEVQRALSELRSTGDLPAAITPQMRTRWVGEAARLNTYAYVEKVAEDPRYHKGHHEKSPRKVGSNLTTFDCLTCDKCVAVCPNNAIFTYVVPHLELPTGKVKPAQGNKEERTGTVRIDERHQIAVLADLCNDCGNCDAFCPEDGGPNLAKPRFFGSKEALLADPIGQGIFVERRAHGYTAWVRSDKKTFCQTWEGHDGRVLGEGFRVQFHPLSTGATVTGDLREDFDLTLPRSVHVVVTGVLSPREVNWVTAMEDARWHPETKSE